MQLRARVDASIDKRRRVMVVGGFIADAPKWEEIESEWRKERDRLGLDHFHMTDFMAKQKAPYKDWGMSERHAVVGRLTTLLNAHAAFSFCVGLNLSDYNSLPEEEKAISNHNPYALCAAQSIGLVAKSFEDHQINERVLYVFESGDDGDRAFREMMSRIATSDETVRQMLRILSVMPGTKRDFPGLDAADFYVWLVAQHVLKSSVYTGGPEVEIDGYLKLLTVESVTHYLGGQMLRDWSKDEPVVREAMRRLFSLDHWYPDRS